MHRFLRFLALLGWSVGAPSALLAQAWAYPSFQAPRIANREFNAGVVRAGASGTTLLFQWREEAGATNQFSVDAGFVNNPSIRNVGSLLFGGAQYARIVATAGAGTPLDLLFTLGGYITVGDLSLLRVPVGLSVGRRLPLGGDVSLTPYAHPRFSIDVARSAGFPSHLSVDVDFGANLDVSKSFSVRASTLLTASTWFQNALGVSVAWRPPGLEKR